MSIKEFAAEALAALALIAGLGIGYFGLSLLS
jgi:hypothetical protein